MGEHYRSAAIATIRGDAAAESAIAVAARNQGFSVV